MTTKLEQMQSVYARLMGFAQYVKDCAQAGAPLDYIFISTQLIQYATLYETITKDKNENAN